MIIDLQYKLRLIGKIRMGSTKVENGTKRPVKLSTFRITSPEKDVIDQVAALYGGAVTACTTSELSGQWEVTTETSDLPVVAGSMPVQQAMELYGKTSGRGVCTRRCNREVEALSGSPCICKAEGREICKPTTRIFVCLADVKALGCFMLESHGWNAAQELVPLFELIRQDPRWKLAHLVAEKRSQTKIVSGKVVTYHYVVPTLRVNASPRELISFTPLSADFEKSLPQSEQPQLAATNEPAT